MSEERVSTRWMLIMTEARGMRGTKSTLNGRWVWLRGCRTNTTRKHTNKTNKMHTCKRQEKRNQWLGAIWGRPRGFPWRINLPH